MHILGHSFCFQTLLNPIWGALGKEEIMKKQITIASLAFAVVGIFGFGLFYSSNPKQSEPVSQVEIVEKQCISISVDGQSVGYMGEVGKTALQTLKELTEVEVEQSSFGEFVTSINGLAANQSSEFWAFYVNDSLAAEGAGTYAAQEGDSFEWRLEEF